MNLYDIDQAILSCIDMETGEVIDEQALADLQMKKDQKIENIACWIKNLRAESEAIGAEIKELQHRKKVAENKAESLKRYLSAFIPGQKWSSGKYAIGWRKSRAVVFDDENDFLIRAQADGLLELLRFKSPEINKTAVKEALDRGEHIDGAHIEDKSNIQIK